MEITRIGQFSLGWGEGLAWDDQRQRLYFVDCAAESLHWLEEFEGDPETYVLDSMVTSVLPTTDGRLVGTLEDGLYVIDPDARTAELLTRYPAEMRGRANDSCADQAGNLITGKLNLGPAEGSAWWYSDTAGWRLIDSDIANTNGPNAGVIGGGPTLIIGDTSANYYAYPYEAATSAVGKRRVFGDVSDLDGMPDGAKLDSEGGLWCALVGGSQLARFSNDGLDRTVPLPLVNPTDVVFGGPSLDRLFVVSVGLGTEGHRLDGALLVIDGLGAVGRPEPRFKIRGN
ncbi:MAG TPA: SMP-30/gluconolactonase/LRE family protein [Acidimicrobiales bacterium]|nr:SMP-30/gluconolactonase/LRE family protein [Acidimicrobiales bacterium]